MTLLDFFRGAGIIFVIMVVAGGIAYVGDRVGHQVGRKRLTLFNIRPKYTSTIVAVGTGVVIAFVVTMTAILLNQQVKTAFFKLNALNESIVELEKQRDALEEKVNRGTLVIPIDTALPYAAQILPKMSAEQRLALLRNFYKSTIDNVNRTYAPFGVKPYKSDGTSDAKIKEIADNKNLESTLAGNVPILVAAAIDRNIYQGDTISVAFTFLSDDLRIPRGATLAQVTVPKGASPNLNLAIAQLETLVSIRAVRDAKLPSFIASRVAVKDELPDASQIQAIIAKGHGFLLTAYASQDVYPHDGNIPITVVFSDAP